MDIQVVLGLASGVTILVEYLKSVASQIPLWNGLTAMQQSIVLQTIAGVAGVASALYMNVNAFPTFPSNTGVIFTGLLASLGSAGIHVIYAWLGMKGGVVAENPVKVQSAGDPTYAPFS